MRIAFKEWAIVVDALGRGEQVVVLRKGGISEGRGGFRPERGAFLLFPTGYHQQRERVIPSAQARFDLKQRAGDSTDRVRIEFFASVVATRCLESLAEAEALRGQHVWRDEVISERFAWGREKVIFALAVRVFRLAMPVELPLLSIYRGCKSWVQLEHDVPADGARPVLDDLAFAVKLKQFQAALDLVAVS